MHYQNYKCQLKTKKWGLVFNIEHMEVKSLILKKTID